MTIYQQSQKEIIKLLRGMTGKFSTYNIWRDFLVLAACAISNSVDKQQLAKREEMYMQTIKKYNKDEADKFAEMLALVTIGFSGGQMGDFLGELYMQLEISNKEVGQFFTPYNVSKLTAELTGVNLVDDIVTLNEPSCGSGGMIIAYAEMMENQGYNYQEKLRVVCNDLDYDVVKMAYIQLSLLGIDAVIMQGDTITQKMNEVWHTPMHLVNKAKENERQKNERMLNAMRKFIDLEKNREQLEPMQLELFQLDEIG